MKPIALNRGAKSVYRFIESQRRFVGNLPLSLFLHESNPAVALNGKFEAEGTNPGRDLNLTFDAGKGIRLLKPRLRGLLIESESRINRFIRRRRPVSVVPSDWQFTKAQNFFRRLRNNFMLSSRLCAHCLTSIHFTLTTQVLGGLYSDQKAKTATLKAS